MAGDKTQSVSRSLELRSEPMDVGSIRIGWLVCAACNADISRTENHHCPEEFENRQQGIDRREQKHNPHVFSEAERLSFGLYLMSRNGEA